MKEAVWLANVERHPLGEQVGDSRHPEGVRRQPPRQPGILEPPLDQLADGFAGEGVGGQLLGTPQRRAEQRPVFGVAGDARRLDIGDG